MSVSTHDTFVSAKFADRFRLSTPCDYTLGADPFCISRHFYLKTHKPYQWIAKRIMDIGLSTLGLIVAAPVLAATAIAIALESRGPVIFTQKRTGVNGKDFSIYKLRSMKQNAEKMVEVLREHNESDNITMFKMENDPRVTRVGKFIRKYSIDELPQLVNVLKGEMSLVGPRPLPNGLEDYKNWHYVRFATLPGLTGMWQISGRSSVKEFDDVAKFDYDYVNNWNILLDLKIILKTFPVVLFGKDAV